MNSPANPLFPRTEDAPPVLVIAAPAHAMNGAEDPGKPDSARQLVLGLLFGVVFGFLLQKRGVAKYEVLMGQLLLNDFTVMLTAIIVGMLGIFCLRAMAWSNCM